MLTLPPKHEAILRRAVGADQTRQPFGYRNHYVVDLRDRADVELLEQLVSAGLMDAGRKGLDSIAFLVTLRGMKAIGLDKNAKARATRARKPYEPPAVPNDNVARNARAKRKKEAAREALQKAS